jgi:iron(III) transport system substrate-binding protein
MVVFLAGCGTRPATLVVYCAHDAVFAENVLRDFERRTGIPIAIKFDTEATKSLGLVELLLREQAAPRCDVFWNNELLGTLQLQAAGALEPYRGAGWERIPVGAKDPAGAWTGFAARLRVIITHTNQSTGTGGAMAKPLFGTTRTHYTVLWHQKGAAWVKEWHRTKGLREATGNAMVKDLVAAGTCAWGYTDTDDYCEALSAGKPVSVQPVRLDNGATICIPNTVAVIRGTKRRATAEKLVDFLLSAETEWVLARSPARQIPLGPVAENTLPPEVREWKRWAADAYPLTALDNAPAECLAWLKEEYAK